jgi:hypothetical protein
VEFSFVGGSEDSGDWYYVADSEGLFAVVFAFGG